MDFLMTKRSLIGHLKRCILIDNCAEWPQKNCDIDDNRRQNRVWLL